jgi:hypothetical protein
VAELADALDLGSSGATRAGSIPVSRTILLVIEKYFVCISDFPHFKKSIIAG